jgi:hypothetical protein
MHPERHKCCSRTFINMHLEPQPRHGMWMMGPGPAWSTRTCGSLREADCPFPQSPWEVGDHCLAIPTQREHCSGGYMNIKRIKAPPAPSLRHFSHPLLCGLETLQPPKPRPSRAGILRALGTGSALCPAEHQVLWWERQVWMQSSPLWVVSFGREAGPAGGLCTVGVCLYHLAVHGHGEGQAQNLWGEWVLGKVVQGPTGLSAHGLRSARGVLALSRYSD